MKKALCVILAIVMIVAFVSACNEAPAAEAPQAAAPAAAPASGGSASQGAGVAATPIEDQTGEGKSIGIASFHLVNDWTVFVVEAAEEYLTARGYEVQTTNAQGDTSQMVRDVENMMERGVDGIILAGGEGGAFIDMSFRARDAGIKMVGMDMYLPGASTGVFADNYTGGTQIGIYLVNHMQGEGKYIVIDSPGWHTLVTRKTMAEAVFRDYPNIQSVGEFEVGPDPIQSGYDTVMAVLRNHPDLKGVIATWGLPGIGAAMAIEEMGLQSQIAVVSADSDRVVLEHMAEPTSPPMAYIGQDPMRNSYLAALYLDRAINFGDDDMNVMTFAPTLMVTNTNYLEDFPEIFRMDMVTLWDQVYAHNWDREFD